MSIYDGYKNLLAAVVTQACNDYMSAVRACARTEKSTDRRIAAEKDLADTERFFRSRRFQDITEHDIDPDILLERLRYLALHTGTYFKISHGVDWNGKGQPQGAVDIYRQ